MKMAFDEVLFSAASVRVSECVSIRATNKKNCWSETGVTRSV